MILKPPISMSDAELFAEAIEVIELQCFVLVNAHQTILPGVRTNAEYAKTMLQYSAYPLLLAIRSVMEESGLINDDVRLWIDPVRNELDRRFQS